MRFLVLNADYPNFLLNLYLSRSGLAGETYAVQMSARNASLFGVADFYSRNFRAHGNEAAEIHVNNRWLQYAWAKEHGLKIPAPSPPQGPSGATGGKQASLARRTFAAVKPILRPIVRRFRRPRAGLPDWEAIVRAQIEDFRPDVILNQEMADVPSSFLKSVRNGERLIIGQIACALPDQKSFGAYDLVISSLPNLVKWFRARGVRAELNRLAFEPSVLEQMGPQPERDIELSFVGSLSPEHGKRIAFLEYLARRTPLKIWGSGIERLPMTSILHGCYQGEVWGREMYGILRRSRITLNHHSDLAGDWANNMRLYEATGMGALLVTDQKRNLHEMFTPGEHVSAYEGPEDCVRQIEAFLVDEMGRAKIAATGQRHTIEVHNYFRRTGEIVGLASSIGAAKTGKMSAAQ